MKSDAAVRIEIRSDDLIRRNPPLYPACQCQENVVLRVGGHRRSAEGIIAEGIWATTPSAVTHSRCHEQPGKLVDVVSAVLFVETFEVIGCTAREDQQIGSAVIGDVLRVVIDETVEISTVGPNHVLELLLGIEEVRDERRLRDGVPIKARVLM